ncbi:hypothetical protein VTH82DRAFT_3786 [Thermothelomyces myriococcoides]
MVGADAGAGPGLAVAAAVPAPPVHTIVGADRPVGGLVAARETPAGAEEERATTARGAADTGSGEPLLRLRTLLHGTDRLMVQALKADDDLPLMTGRRRARSRYVQTRRVKDARIVNELREMELKEKIKKMRFSKSGDDNIEANAT